MRAAVYHGPGDVRLADVPAPAAAPGELLLRVATAGICGTDLTEYARGPVLYATGPAHPVTGHSGPLIPGHEFSGWVAAVGAGVAGFAAGDLVATGAGVWCGRCAACRRGATNLCASYWTVGLQRAGGLAEYASVPARACLNLAGRAVSADVAALGQPMSIALHAVRRGGPQPGQQVAVLGSGGVGMFVTCALALSGAQVTVVDLDPARLALAERLGAAGTVAVSAAAPLLDQVRDLLGAPDLVFECTGTAAALPAALAVTPPGARIVVVGLPTAAVPVDFRAFSLAEKDLIGTVAHVFGRDFADAIDLLAADPAMWTDVAPLVRPLSEVVSAGLAGPPAGGPQQIKLLFDPSLTDPRPLRTAPAPPW